jgi:hypothetical protein
MAGTHVGMRYHITRQEVRMQFRDQAYSALQEVGVP